MVVDGDKPAYRRATFDSFADCVAAGQAQIDSQRRTSPNYLAVHRCRLDLSCFGELAFEYFGCAFASDFLGLAEKRKTPIYGWFTEGFDTRDLKESEGAAGGVGGVN
jgi:hypothetical protein